MTRDHGGKQVCAVPGCGRVLSRHNSRGVCATHNHHADYCRCTLCVARNLRDGGSQNAVQADARRILIDGDEPGACRRLWISAACIAVTDAAADMAKVRMSGDADRVAAVLRRHEYYFRSRDWRELCGLAGISCKPDAVVDFLRSDRVGISQHAVQLSHGLVEGASRGRSQRVAA